MAYMVRGQPSSAAVFRWSLALLSPVRPAVREQQLMVQVSGDVQDWGCILRPQNSGSCLSSALRMRIMRDFAVVATVCRTCCLRIGMRFAKQVSADEGCGFYTVKHAAQSVLLR